MPTPNASEFAICESLMQTKRPTVFGIPSENVWTLILYFTTVIWPFLSKYASLTFRGS